MGTVGGWGAGRGVRAEGARGGGDDPSLLSKAPASSLARTASACFWRTYASSMAGKASGGCKGRINANVKRI